MPLEYFKSLNKFQNDHKIKEKYNMYYNEDYVSLKQERKHASHIHKDPYNAELLNEKCPEFLDMFTDKIPERENTNSHTGTTKHTKQKQSHGSYSHEIQSHLKKESYDNPLRKKDCASKNIPIEKELLEFSIARSQCPMVVRIHKGSSKKQKKKQLPNSQSLTQSLSCPQSIEIYSQKNRKNHKNHLKIISESKNPLKKERKPKSKHELLFHRYKLSELLSLGPTKIGIGTNSNLDTVISIRESNKPHSKKILKNKYELQNSCLMNRIVNNCAGDNKEQQNYISSKKSIMPHKISVKDKHNDSNKKSGHSEVRKNSNSNNHKNLHKTSDRCHSITYLNIKTPMEIISNPDGDETDLVCNTDNSGDLKMKEIYSPRKMSKALKSKIRNDDDLSKKPSEVILLDNNADCNCQRCKRNQIEAIKNNKNYFTSQSSLEIIEIQGENNAINKPHKSSKPEKIPSRKAFLHDNNIVILDASQSQFHRISAFLKNRSSKHSLSIDSDQLNISSSTLDKIFFCDDQEYINDTTNIKNTQIKPHGLLRKIRSEEKNLETYSSSNNSSLNKNVTGLSNPLRYNSSFPALNIAPLNSYKDKLDKTNQSKCLRCNKSVCGIMNFDPYCSDCNLKVKLSQISNESGKNNQNFKLKKGQVTSTKQGPSLTTIPESNSSISKELVNVAIQTEKILETSAIKEDKKTNIFSELSLAAAFKLYCNMAPHLENEHEISNSQIKEFLAQYNNVDLLFNQNIFDADFEREIQVKELESKVHEENQSFSTDHNLRRHPSSVENLGSPLPISMNPTKRNYESRTINDNFLTENCIVKESITAENNVKTTDLPFVSPIFPEKEYCKIIDNKPNLYSSLNHINEGKTDLNNILDCVEKYTSSDHNFHKICDKNPAKGSVSLEKIVIFDIEKSNINKILHTTEENSIGETIMHLPCKSEFIPQKKETTPHELPSINVEYDSLSLDNSFKNVRPNSNEHHKKNFRHTLPRDFSNQGLKFQLPFQSMTCSNQHPTVCHTCTIDNEKSRNGQQSFVNNAENDFYSEIFKGKTLNSTRLINSSNESSKKWNKIDLNVQFKRVELPKEIGMNINNVVGNNIKYQNISTHIVDKSNATRNAEGMAEETKVIGRHTFSYIYINLSGPTEGYDSDNEEGYEMHDSFDTGLVLMPETKIHSYDKKVNDLLVGNNFTSLINSKLMFRSETDNEEFNVFETKALSKLSIVIGNEENVRNYSENVEGNPLKYGPIRPSFEKNNLDKPSNIREKVGNSIAHKNSLKTLITDENCEVKEKNIKLRDTMLKKNKCEIEKKPRPKKPRDENKKFVKMNNLFMCGYMAQVSLFRFVGVTGAQLNSHILNLLKKIIKN